MLGMLENAFFHITRFYVIKNKPRSPEARKVTLSFFEQDELECPLRPQALNFCQIVVEGLRKSVKNVTEPSPTHKNRRKYSAWNAKGD